MADMTPSASRKLNLYEVTLDIPGHRSSEAKSVVAAYDLSYAIALLQERVGFAGYHPGNNDLHWRFIGYAAAVFEDPEILVHCVRDTTTDMGH